MKNKLLKNKYVSNVLKKVNVMRIKLQKNK